MSRVVQIVRDVTKLNVESCSALLNLLTTYVKAVDGIIRSSVSDQPDASRQPNKTGSEPRRSPVLFAGPMGEVAGGAFIVNNPSPTDLSLSFAVQGELPPDAVQLVPPSVSVKAGESAVIQIKVPISENLEEGRDYVGMVCVPGLSNQVVDLVVRRLPGSAERG
ncbi:MAG TPA: hypothetical protein VK456_15260 [Xanthobacteraceae bacterium]|nr:hypothetical protein [Xanthobacteraceae bacterium]